MLCTILNGNLIQTFHKLNIHAGTYVFTTSLDHCFNFILPALSPKEVQEFFIPVVRIAKHLLKIYEEKPLKGMNKPPVVTVSD